MRYRVALSAEAFSDRIVERFDGVGLLRGEYVCRRRNEYITLESCRESLRRYLCDACLRFHPKPVWYRTTELETGEINVLGGADHVIDGEPNPMLGLRGIRRAVRFPEAFETEIRLLSEIAAERSNLNVLFPFVYDPTELRFAVDHLRSAGFANRFGMMAEIPSAILDLEAFLELGVSNVTLGLNDLTSLTLGAPRGSDYADFGHSAVLSLIRTAREKTRAAGVELSVAGYFDPAFVRTAERLGLDYAVLHYSMIPQYLGAGWDDLPDAKNLESIKEMTRARIRERSLSLARQTVSQQ